MLTVADMGGGGSKIAKKVLTYFMDGPLCFLFSLKNLKSLRFDGCHLRSIPTRAFWGLNNLVSLTVATRNAGVLSIEAGAFAGLNSLEQLDLSGNYIRHLAPGVLCSLPKLTVLNLSKNEIGSLSDLGLLEVSTYLQGWKKCTYR